MWGLCLILHCADGLLALHNAEGSWDGHGLAIHSTPELLSEIDQLEVKSEEEVRFQVNKTPAKKISHSRVDIPTTPKTTNTVTASGFWIRQSQQFLISC